MCHFLDTHNSKEGGGDEKEHSFIRSQRFKTFWELQISKCTAEENFDKWLFPVSGRVGLCHALDLVTYCCGCKAACWGPRYSWLG